MKKKLFNYLTFAATFPYGLYFFYFFWGVASGRDRLGEASEAYFFLIGFVAAGGFSLLALVLMVAAFARTRLTFKDKALLGLFFVAIVVWWTTWLMKGDTLQNLPFGITGGQ
jgi:hypothetical protein